MSLESLAMAPDLTHRVYQAIRHAIVTGELAPGARLTQENLASRLAVSRQPVLQALRLLKSEGFVVDAPVRRSPSDSRSRSARGVMVSPLDAHHILHVYQVRCALDALAARLAARARAKLPKTLIQRGRKAASEAHIVDMINADFAFHDAVYTASGNPLISEAAHRHWQPIRRAMGAVLQHVETRASVWDEHEAIREAIVLGDEAKAEALMYQHGESAGRALADRLEPLTRCDPSVRVEAEH